MKLTSCSRSQTIFMHNTSSATVSHRTRARCCLPFPALGPIPQSAAHAHGTPHLVLAGATGAEARCSSSSPCCCCRSCSLASTAIGGLRGALTLGLLPLLALSSVKSGSTAASPLPSATCAGLLLEVGPGEDCAWGRTAVLAVPVAPTLSALSLAEERSGEAVWLWGRLSGESNSESPLRLTGRPARGDCRLSVVVRLTGRPEAPAEGLVLAAPAADVKEPQGSEACGAAAGNRAGWVRPGCAETCC